MRRFFVLAALLALVAAPFAATAQEAPHRLESLVPANTFFFASLNNVSEMRAQCSRSAMGKLWNEPEVQKFVAPAMEELKKHLREAEKNVGHPILGILDAIRGQAAVAVVSYDPLYGGQIPDAVILIDLGAARADFQKIHREAIEKAGDRVGVAKKEHAGVAFDIITMKGGVQLSVGYLGNSLVVTTTGERMRDVIDATQGKLEKSLAANPTFMAVRKRTGENAYLSAFLNTESMMTHFGDRMPPMATHIMDKLALTTMKGIGFGSSFAGEGIRETFFAHIPGEKQGLMKLFYTAPGEGTALLERVPQSAFYAAAGRADLEKMYTEIMKLVGDVNPDALEQVMGGIYQMEEFLGLRIREDLLAPLGTDMAAYAAMPEGGGLIPDLVMMVKLDEPEKFAQSLVTLIQRGQEMMQQDGQYSMELRNLEYAGKKIFYVHIAQQWGDPVPVTPAYVRDGDLAYMALYPQVLKDLAARNFTGPSILTRPDFTRAIKGLPEGMSSVEYMDFAAIVRICYGTLVPVAQLAAKQADLPMDMALLPRTETVAKHFFGGVWGAKLTDDGIAIHASTPCGVMPTMLITMAPLLMFAGAREVRYSTAEMVPGEIVMEPESPAPAKPPRKAKPATAETSLEKVYVALLWHYADKGKYPDDLGDLVTTGALDDAASLVLAGDSAPATLNGGVKSSFAYVGAAVGDLAEGRDKAIWVYSRGGLGGEGRWVLFADGSRKMIPEAEFTKLMESTKAAMKK